MSMELFGVEFANANIRTHNGRIYSIETLQQAIDKVRTPMFGQFTGSMESYVDHSRTTHQCTNLRMEGNVAKCDVKLLATPYGMMLEQLLCEDLEYSLCVRGHGLVDEFGVVTELDIISIDVEMAR
jgi:hypothetical protein